MRTLLSNLKFNVIGQIIGNKVLIEKNGSYTPIEVGQFCSRYLHDGPIDLEKFVLLSQKGYTVIADATPAEVLADRIRKQVAEQKKKQHEMMVQRIAEAEAEMTARRERADKERQEKLISLPNAVTEVAGKYLLADGSIVSPAIYNSIVNHNVKVNKEYQQSQACAICIAFV